MTQGLIANAYDRAIPLIARLMGAPLGQKVAIGARDYWAAATPSSALAMDGLNLVLIALVIAVSWRTFRWIEEPARRYFNRVASRFEAPRRAGRAPIVAKA
jgi:peptidoglycan/LPS O-acetylase OafA/YrhL